MAYWNDYVAVCWWTNKYNKIENLVKIVRKGFPGRNILSIIDSDRYTIDNLLKWDRLNLFQISMDVMMERYTDNTLISEIFNASARSFANPCNTTTGDQKNSVTYCLRK